MSITVEMGKYEVATYGTISTYGAGPCIIVGIYDKRNRRAYMIHEDSAIYSKMINEFIEEVINGSDKKDLKAYVRGGAYNPKDEDEKNLVEANREKILNALHTILEEHQIDLKWKKSNMCIDTDTGKIGYRCL